MCAVITNETLYHSAFRSRLGSLNQAAATELKKLRIERASDPRRPLVR